MPGPQIRSFWQSCTWYTCNVGRVASFGRRTAVAPDSTTYTMAYNRWASRRFGRNLMVSEDHNLANYLAMTTSDYYASATTPMGESWNLSCNAVAGSTTRIHCRTETHIWPLNGENATPGDMVLVFERVNP
jgi:hypothetical protein